MLPSEEQPKPKFRRPLPKDTIRGVYGQIGCPAGCGEFALFHDERRFPLHEQRAVLVDRATGQVVGEQFVPCPVSGQVFR